MDAVTTDRREDWLIRLDWQRIDVSDAHSVPSLAVCPIRLPAVYVARVMPPPCIVMLLDPVEARFTAVSTLKEAEPSVDHAWDTVEAA